MRIYLEQTREFMRGDVKHVAHGGAFYDLPAEVVEPWLVEKVAKHARDNNTVIEEPPPDTSTPADQAPSLPEESPQ